MTAEPQPAPGEPASNPKIVMHGQSRDNSAFTQIGTQVNVLPAAPPEVRYSLPPDTVAFTGRDQELSQVNAAVARAAGVVAVGAIDGMPGVGKTALAVHAAYVLRQRFPDRQLFVDLHAHTPGRKPVRPEDALAGLLTAAGVDARFLPDDLDGRAAMWRDKMVGQRALLVLDNAASASQVSPLLPGAEGCLVLVTSRRHLGDLPGAVTPVLVDVLPPDTAREMFIRLALRAEGSDEAVAEVVRLAGFLPLAISLLARVLARHPSWTLDDLAAETRRNLLTLTAEHDSIAAAFEVSYQHLDPARQRLFCLLGLHPGTTTEVYAAAALAGTSPAEVAGLLDGLHGEGLLIESGPRRYGMHDLLRRYAREHAGDGPGDDFQRALQRLLDYYQHTAARADARIARRIQPGTPPAAPPELLALPDLEDDGQALAWARADRANMLACLDHATRTGQHTRVVGITAALGGLLRRDGPWADAIIRHSTAVHSAQHLDDRLGQAGALHDLGVIRAATGDYPGGVQAQEQALSMYRDLGDRLGQANALRELGAVRRLTGDYPSAAQALEQALSNYRELRDQIGQAHALRELGAVQLLTGDYPSAAQALEQASSIYRDLGSRLGHANTLNDLGEVRRLAGDYLGAAQAQEQALAICRDLGDRLGQAYALNELGMIGRVTGDYPAAAQAQEQSLIICRDLGDRLGQAAAYYTLGTIRLVTGDHQGAVQALEQALIIYRHLGSRLGQANALNELGAVRRVTGDYPGAAEALQQALNIYREVGDRGGETQVLNERGTLHRVNGQLAQAEGCHQQALELARAISSSWDEAHALAGLGRCAGATGQAMQAQTLLRQALEIFQQIGAAEAPDLRAELNTFARPQQTE
jgi:tetratricopeptide (TPR) repeat protein